jgi:uncharacterized protein (TIGR03032 family)
MQPDIKPFSCKYSSIIPSLLLKLNISLAFTTYQAGKLIFLSAKDENSIIQLPRTFNKPMGIAIENQKIALATKNSITVFVNDQTLCSTYPSQLNTYDALYIPRVSYNTGILDVHDLHFDNNNIIAVNTAFNCLMKTSDTFSFEPIWQPNFINKMQPDDSCHLNGLAINKDDWFVTSFNNGNTPKSWKENITKSGLLIHTESQEVILNSLAMPHSPRFYKNELYLLLSASGELVKVNIKENSFDPIVKIKGFVRGLSILDDYAFIGLSKLRKGSSTFSKLPIAEFSDRAGIVVVKISSGKIIGKIIYESSVEEIYDVQIIKDKIRPNILNTDKPEHSLAVSLPNTSWWASSIEKE